MIAPFYKWKAKKEREISGSIRTKAGICLMCE